MFGSFGDNKDNSINSLNQKYDHSKLNFLSKRPNRDIAINDEDIMNLKIAIETSKTLEQFLDAV